MPFVKILIMKKYLSFMFELTKGYKIHFVLVLIIIFLYSFFSTLASYNAKLIVDCYSYSQNLDTPDIFSTNLVGPVGTLLLNMLGGVNFVYTHKWIIAISTLVIGLITALFFIFRGIMRGKIDTGISKKIRLILFYHIERLPYSFIKTHNNGDLLQTCMRDEKTLRHFVSRQFFSLWQTLLTLILSFVILVTLDYKIALMSIALLPPLMIYSYFLIRKEAKLYRITDDSEAVVIGKIEENINSIRVVKAYNNERKEIKIFKNDLNDYKKKYIKWRRVGSLFFSTTDILVFGEIIATALVSAYLCYRGEISLGTLIISITYTSAIVWPIRESVSIFNDFSKAMVAVDRMKLILDFPLEDIDSGLVPKINGDIIFDNVSFKFEDDNKPALNSVSFHIKKGQTVAIMGKTGSGKSTLSSLLTRLYDYTSGTITIDGVVLKEIQKKHIRKNVAIVLQEPFLFSRTIYENMTIAHKEVTIEDVNEALKTADFYDTVKVFKDGYNTVIGERGTTLSGGQRQRLAMARTILNDAPIVIFDDSLSAVDAQTDIRIRSALKKRETKATTIIITHRVMTAKDADLIIILDDGKIEQIGSHKDLINKKGFYQNIYSMQTRVE